MHIPWRPVILGDGPAIDTSVTLAETETLQSLAVQANVLEIGAAYGYSACAMALAGANVTSVDPHLIHGSASIMRTNLKAYGVAGQVTQRIGWNYEVLPQLADEGMRFDLVFIDGDHTAWGVEYDVSWAKRLLKPGGALACHDYTEACCCPEVGPTLDRLFVDPPLKVVDTLYVVEP